MGRKHRKGLRPQECDVPRVRCRYAVWNANRWQSRLEQRTTYGTLRISPFRARSDELNYGIGNAVCHGSRFLGAIAMFRPL